MPTITINRDYVVEVDLHDTTYEKHDDPVGAEVGYTLVGAKGYHRRIGIKFLLSFLPAGADVTQVRLKVYCNVAGGAAHLTDIHAYNDDGQADPEADGAQTCYDRCAPAGTPYIDDSVELRTLNGKWFDLGAQACIDVENAKSAVNRFSVALHEEGDNDEVARIRANDVLGDNPVLEVTYESPAAAAGYSYSDGLVSIQVVG